MTAAIRLCEKSVGHKHTSEKRIGTLSIYCGNNGF